MRAEKTGCTPRRFLTRLPLALLGSLLMGVGLSFNACAGLGNDPYGLVYDGLRQLLGLDPAQAGICAAAVNGFMILLLLIVGRRYLNIGTVAAVVPYQLCVQMGTALYGLLFPTEQLPVRIIVLILGCLLLYTGIAVFLTADIGMEPITGVIMVLKDRLGWSFARSKWLLDFSMLGLGLLLGGKAGAVTLLTAVIAGPSIDLIHHFILGKLKGGLDRERRSEDAAQNRAALSS